MSTQTASASNNESVAAVLLNRGFEWQPFDVDKVHFESHSISFEHEWTQFASLVATMTRNAVGDNAPLAAPDAWTNHFQNVIANSGKRGKRGKRRKREETFKNGLFEALRNSLSGFIHPISSDLSNSNVIMLQCTSMNVGFGKEINREELGFDESYGLAKKSQPDHGCFVFGTKKRQSPGSDITADVHDMTAVVELKLESSSCRSFAVYNDEDGSGEEEMSEEDTDEEGTTDDEENDKDRITLKDERTNEDKQPNEESKEVYTMDRYSTENIPHMKRDATIFEVPPNEETIEENSTESRPREIKAPIFESAHGPMGQAMLYSMDVWHCLARRGVSVMSVPVVVLAGKSESKDNPNRICCLEAHIQIPEYCGQRFVYSVDRIVSFDGTIGSQIKESGSAEMAAEYRNTRDKRAIAIYIRTMRNGLELAMQIRKNQEDSDTIYPPLSLFCRHLLKSGINTPLIASPIRYANSFQGYNLKVKQGELFQLLNPKKEDFLGLANLQWFTDVKIDLNGIKVDVKLPDYCLVKVSCAAVHNTSVSQVFCDKALEKLLGASVELKKELSKVLLGFCHTGESVSLVTIMKDLRAGEQKFQMLEHKKIRRDGKLPQLWSAFCVLVKSLLLPMANIGVIHLDIRSDAVMTHNILLHENQSSVYDNQALFELRLIDFDSVVFRGSTSGTRQPYGIYWKDLRFTIVGNEWESSHRYLFWQVLWIAYTWYPAAPSASNTQPKKRSARSFVQFFWGKKYCVNFKKWLKIGTVQSLKLMNDGTITSKTIIGALDCLGEAFSGVSFSGLCPEKANIL
jgi:hypothetical protein